MVHHADFAVPLAQRMVVETSLERPDGEGKVAGRALALGWWVTPPGEPDPEEPAGTLYLLADESLPRPVWVAQAQVVAFKLED
jgi:hypothetical protein